MLYVFATQPHPSCCFFYHTAQVYGAFTDLLVLLGRITSKIIGVFSKNSRHDTLGGEGCCSTHHDASLQSILISNAMLLVLAILYLMHDGMAYLMPLRTVFLHVKQAKQDILEYSISLLISL